MKHNNEDKIVYSINLGDIQEVAHQVLGRNLTREEIILVEDSIAEYIDWFQAIVNSITDNRINN